jgi:hypothetical protein
MSKRRRHTPTGVEATLDAPETQALAVLRAVGLTVEVLGVTTRRVPPAPAATARPAPAGTHAASVAAIPAGCTCSWRRDPERGGYQRTARHPCPIHRSTP